MRPGAALAAAAVVLAGAVVLGWTRVPPDGTTASRPDASMPASPTGAVMAPSTASSTMAPSTTGVTAAPEIVEFPMPTWGVVPIVWLHALVAVSSDEAWAVVASAEDSAATLLIARSLRGQWALYQVTGSGWGAVGLAAAPDNTIWAATGAGVFQHDGGTWVPRAEGPVAGVAVSGDGTVWIGGRRDGIGGPADPRPWLARLEAGSWLRVDPSPDALPDGALGARIAPAPGGGAWIALRPGWWVEDDLMYYDGTEMRVVTITGVPDAEPDDAMPAVRVFEVEVAADGGVWAVGYLNADPRQGVLARLGDGEWQVVDWPFPASDDGLVDVDAAASPDGTMWFAAGTGGLWSFDGALWREHLGGAAALNVDVAPDGTVWYADGERIHCLCGE